MCDLSSFKSKNIWDYKCQKSEVAKGILHFTTCLAHVENSVSPYYVQIY